MKIVIAGDGVTGTYLADILSVENQDVVLMGQNAAHLQALSMQCNYITFGGSPLLRRHLEQCGINEADLFISVLLSETENLVACSIAKEMGARRCVARIDTPEFDSQAERTLFRRMGVDDVMYPERLAAQELKNFLSHNWVSEWLPIGKGELYVTGVRMEPSGMLCGTELRHVPNNPRLFHVVAIKRDSEIILPRGDDRLLAGDTVFFSTDPANLHLLPGYCGKQLTDTRRIMIAGGGRITENLLELTQGCGYDITVFDPDPERCSLLAGKFPKTVVANAAVNDLNTLRDEGLSTCDTFLALTGSSETNIVACMVARENGVRSTVARIEELQYRPEAESLNINKIISKKLLNTGKIFNSLVGCNVSTSASAISLGTAEVSELLALPTSKITSRPIAELSLPREITVAGYIRDGKGHLAEGSTQIRPGDYVALFSLAGSLQRVLKFF